MLGRFRRSMRVGPVIAATALGPGSIFADARVARGHREALLSYKVRIR